MAFRAIGDLAVEVLGNAMTAAHAAKLRNKFGGGSPHREEGNEPPVTLYGRGGPERNVNERDGARSPASSDREVPRRTSEERAGDTYRTHMRPALRLVTGNRCIDRASPTRRPTVARSIHLVLISSEGHAALANSP
jgi:hypothetical protein